MAPALASPRRTLYEEAPDEFVIPNRSGDPTSGGKVFRRDKSVTGPVVYSTELTREDLLRDTSVKRKNRKK